ncbi:3-methyl-2-oxobutanoate hydroxymethyltransferase [Rhizobium sp. AC44/96]|uniref:3-methyl-2-oxobutanoate hydroxymethyltransferase n=1 Tax=Rhizobium sp. AC44/96 TaxID=1841654 RepID=UPI00080FAE28|nr:3-methyl-2-oxobutanoate hydroxymethyltransferase [Rhizobium sp. AC44/96]OCJ14436.1 3-methyl-2-oxobutanoate hydroxymethyltransferase [Rhizobium sp. AC44/96]
MMRKKPTIADLRSLKGRSQRTMLRVTTLEEAAAAEEAGIDIVSVTPELVTHRDYRTVAPTLFSMTGLTHLEAGTREDYLRWAGNVINAGADAIYCSGSMATVEYLAREHIPVVGHVGLVPSRATWTGGFRAVGKTSEQALAMLKECRAYQHAGAFAVEIEVVPVEVATAISARLDLLLWSMGAGAGCDAQYLFACDILGTHEDHLPRHSKVYRNFSAEFARLQAERVAAFREFKTDVEAGHYPEERHMVRMSEDELRAFEAELEPAAGFSVSKA